MEKEIMKVYTAKIPYAVVLFGKPFEVRLELMFEFAESEDSKFRLEIKSLTGTAEDGFVKDYSHLVEEDSKMSAFIIDCVVGNRATWVELAE